MAKTAAEHEAAVSQEHKDMLSAAGISVGGLIAWILKHGCDAAPAARELIPLLNLPPAVQTAILAVLDQLCPS